MNIRNATREDVGVLVEFQQAMAAETEDRGLDPGRLRQGIEYLLKHPDEGYYLIAETDGRAAGSLMVTFEWSDWRNGRFWWIQSVYVHEAFRRRGVYSQLHASIRQRALDDPQGCGIRLYVESENETAQRTYDALGMAETHYRLFEEEFEDRG